MSAYTPKPGDIGLVKMPGTVGRLIRFGQWLNGDGYADYEHAFVVVDGGKVIEAMPGGALLSPLAKYDGLNPVYLRCPDCCGPLIADEATAFRGTPYSFADYVALAAHRFHIRTPYLKRFIEGSGHMICSQLADLAAELAGWDLFDDDRWFGDVTPGDLYKLYKEQEGNK